jgi:hypothetical protein
MVSAMVRGARQSYPLAPCRAGRAVKAGPQARPEGQP